MSIFPPPRTYLEQAKADFRASKVVHSDLRGCHTRYLLQQAYEKAVKAYMLAKLGPEDAQVELLVEHHRAEVVECPRGLPVPWACAGVRSAVDLFA